MAKVQEYGRLAVEMANRFHRTFGVTEFSQAFLTVPVLVPLLGYFKQTASNLRRGSGAPEYEHAFYTCLAEFASMNHRDPYASRRFSDTAAAAHAFVLEKLDPTIVEDSAVYKHQEYLHDLKRKGIDFNNKRVASRNPAVLSRGLPPMKSAEHRGRVPRQTDGYLLSHPNAQGRERQRAALVQMGYYDDAGARGVGGCLALSPS
jgi:hypothetical protein